MEQIHTKLSEKIIIRAAKLIFTLEALKSGNISFFPASVFRGMIAREIRKASCIFPDIECEQCSFIKTCAYGAMFEPTAEQFAPDFADRMRNISPPLIIETPFFPEGRWEKGNKIKLKVSFLGDTVERAFYIYEALQLIGQQFGVGSDRIKFKVVKIEEVVPHRGTKELSFEDLISDRLSPQLYIWKKPENEINRLLIDVETPLRIQNKGNIMREFSL